MPSIRILVVLASFALTACLGLGDDGPDRLGPDFQGIVAVTIEDSDSVGLVWPRAVDDRTAAEAIRYEIYRAEGDADFEPAPERRVATLRDRTSYDVTGLAPGTTYRFLVVAVDATGNRSSRRVYRSVTTPTTSLKRTATPMRKAEDLRLGTPRIVGTTYRFGYDGGQSLPESGAVLVGADGEGQGYLRRVVAARVVGDEVVVETADASLDDLVAEGTIGNAITLVDLGTLSTPGLQSVPAAVEVREGSGVRRSLTLAGGGLVIEQRDLATSPASPARLVSVRNPTDPASYRFSFSQEFGSTTVAMGVDLGFTPTLRTTADMSLLGGVRSAEVVAEGVLNFDALLALTLEAEKEVVAKRRLFRTVYRQVYAVGPGIPVYQEIIFTLDAEISAKATGALTTSATLDSSADVRFGLVYDGRRWTVVGDRSVEKSLTFDLNANETVRGELRLVPNLAVRFYRVAAAGLSLEPYAYVTETAEFNQTADLLGDASLSTYRVTDMQGGVGFRANAYAELKILSKTLARYPESGKLTLFEAELPVVTLPTLSVTPVGAPVVGFPTLRLYGRGDDGLKNRFVPSSAAWFVYPSTADVTAVSSGDQSIVEFTPREMGKVYTVFFAGNGELFGNAYRPPQYATTTIDMKDDDNDGLPNDWERFYGLDPASSFDAAADPDGDQLTNLGEYQNATNPKVVDTDLDGMSDYCEVGFQLDPRRDDHAEDPDADGLDNLKECGIGTDPHRSDSDRDGMPDGWEDANGLDPLVDDGALDPDGDALANLEEYRWKTLPATSDTDGDGMPDGWEVRFRLDPLKDGRRDDSDADGLLDPVEYRRGTDPGKADTDGDGMPDAWEVGYVPKLDPVVDDAQGDPDNDGIRNIDEYLGNTDPTVPNGFVRRIFYVTKRAGNRDIYAINPQDLSQTPVAATAADERSPDVSPSGTTIAYAFKDILPGSVYELRAVDFDGTNPRSIARAPLDGNGFRQNVFAPVWSRDGQRIGFLSSDVFVVDNTGVGLTNLTNQGGFHSALSWSPDGQRIYYAAFMPDQGSNNVYVVDTQTQAITNLTGYAGPAVGEVQFAVVSPDGSRVAFVRRRRDTNAGILDKRGIFVVPSSGGPITDVSQLACDCQEYLTRGAWSPDGSQLVFSSNRSGDFEIYRVGADGTGLVNLTNSPASDDFSPDWSPAGDKIVFATNRDAGDWEIYMMNADGSAPINLTNTPGIDQSPVW